MEKYCGQAGLHSRHSCLFGWFMVFTLDRG
jgi:hypothetical protein